MLTNVIFDLTNFLMFFMILLINFSLIFQVMNINEDGEYSEISPFAGSVLSTFRLSLGDFSWSLVEVE
jgi:hypothetical protein